VLEREGLNLEQTAIPARRSPCWAASGMGFVSEWQWETVRWLVRYRLLPEEAMKGLATMEVWLVQAC
jgi:hypothetical protein